jgi:hypothetical protein
MYLAGCAFHASEEARENIETESVQLFEEEPGIARE